MWSLGKSGHVAEAVNVDAATLADADPNGFDPREYEPLLGALLCASLFPQIIMIKTEVSTALSSITSALS